MLKRTLVHLPGIGLQKEQTLCNQGIHDWTALRKHIADGFRPAAAKKLLLELEKTHVAYHNRNFRYFQNLLPRSELWRLVPGHEKHVAFLDIETTGLAFPPRGSVTVLSVLLNGRLYQAHGARKIRELLRLVEERAAILCTYYGQVFDVPFLRSQFKVPLNKAELDLCFFLRRQGYTGGLKTVEKRICRSKRISDGIYGWHAPLLWNMHLTGNPKALATLCAYNSEDTLVLQQLLVHAMSRELKARKIRDVTLEFLRAPRPKGEIYLSVLRELKKSFDDY